MQCTCRVVDYDRWYADYEEINMSLQSIRSTTATMNGDSRVEKMWIHFILERCGMTGFAGLERALVHHIT